MLRSSLVFNEEATLVAIVKRNIPMTKTLLKSKDSKIYVEHWRHPIIKALSTSAQSLNLKILRNYFLLV